PPARTGASRDGRPRRRTLSTWRTGMTRTAGALLMFITLAAAAPGAPGLKSKDLPTFHPTTVGARWVYQDLDAERTFVVSRVESKDGAVIVDVAVVEDGRESPAQQMRVSADGVFRLSVPRFPSDQPECLLKLPHKDGQSWEYDLRPVAEKGTMTAVRRE